MKIIHATLVLLVISFGALADGNKQITKTKEEMMSKIYSDMRAWGCEEIKHPLFMYDEYENDQNRVHIDIKCLDNHQHKHDFYFRAFFLKQKDGTILYSFPNFTQHYTTQ